MEQVSKSTVRFWQIVWFLTLESEWQKSHLPDDPEWFFKQTNKNFGANFLLGICLSYLELLEAVQEIKHESIDDIKKQIWKLLKLKDARRWEFERLVESDEWHTIRLCSSRLLDLRPSNIYTPQKLPQLTDIIDVEHYAYISEWRR
jgi:hypothetical protein